MQLPPSSNLTDLALRLGLGAGGVVEPSGPFLVFSRYTGFPGGSLGEESACDAEDPCSVPGLGRSRGEGNGNPLQYSCLENSMDRELAGYSPWGHQEWDTAE